MKLTNKRTHIVFKSMADRNKATVFIENLGIFWEGILRKPVIIIAPSKYLKYDLDLYLPEHIAATTFKYKN